MALNSGMYSKRLSSMARRMNKLVLWSTFQTKFGIVYRVLLCLSLRG